MEVNHPKVRKEKSFGPDGSPKAGGNNVKQRGHDDAGKEYGKRIRENLHLPQPN
jgi:hypothetical protein